MKLHKFYFLLFIVTCVFGGLCAETSLEVSKRGSKLEKVYVDDCSVNPITKSIVITKGKSVFSVHAIRVDQKGLFIMKRDLAASSQSGPCQTKRKYKCDRCPRVFDSEQELAWHYLVDHAGH